MIVVTGATGQLGRLVIASLMKRGAPANQARRSGMGTGTCGLR